MASLLQFVDSISSNPTVLLDINDGTTWKMLEGTDFPPPPMEQVFASTLLVDGAVNPASKYGLRTLSLELGLKTSSADSTATALQSLFRELDRSENLIRWQPQGITEPVFFRTFRTSASSVQRYGQPNNQQKTVTVDIRAEHAAYGLLHTPVSAVTVSTDPAAVSNGCFVDVTGVKGDVEVPAIIRWPSSAVEDDREAVFATRRRGDPSAAPFLFQAEAMTQGTDTTTQANDANFSGSGNNYSRCTFATNAAMATRLSLTDLGTPSVDLRGRYRVFLRYKKNTSGDGINLQLRWGDVDGWVVVDNDAFATPSSVSRTTADLGLISIPVGQDPVVDGAGVELPVSDSFRLEVRAERTSGSGTIDFDFPLLVPADDRLAIVHWNDASSSPTDHWILDADGTTAHARDASGQVISAGSPAVAGGFPMLSPGVTNRIVMLRSTRPTDVWAFLTVSPVSVSYFPRYLSVRPAAT